MTSSGLPSALIFENCTVLTIPHRLDTIIGYTRRGARTQRGGAVGGTWWDYLGHQEGACRLPGHGRAHGIV